MSFVGLILVGLWQLNYSTPVLESSRHAGHLVQGIDESGIRRSPNRSGTLSSFALGAGMQTQLAVFFKEIWKQR
jgi:hypothetical protein